MHSTCVFFLISTVTLLTTAQTAKEIETATGNFVRFLSSPDFSMAKRGNLMAFDSLGGMGLGKRSDAHSLSMFDSLAGTGLGKRSHALLENEKRRFGNFDQLAGLGLGKRSNYLNSFDSLGGLGLGKK